MFMEMPRAPEKPQEDQLRSSMRVQTPSDEEIRDGNGKGCFLPLDRKAREGRRLDFVADIDVSDDCEDCVIGCRETLQHIRRFHGVAGVPHLGDQNKEHEMAGIGEYRICDGYECVCEGGVECDGNGAS